ncbi:heavy metal sensor histidine kinase [Pantoea phytobeneficialis]|uniref:Sensor protein n=1 Tax=Pantoea phytobeneficialis TaxID=2052056 RepID=A0AAP9HBA8_9GAMM|nr:heavy metal sensor histidine kinase [Pantoea phytobeneficialis]MDO6406986.1 heavy metal sensor histidine kinase [Pantoea phytobeneficialis]QGR09951.1 two-component sensor histidine kinase [Pantoea phytobeneficialis]
MKRASLTFRLSLLLAAFSFVASAVMGSALYYALRHQLSLRDDAALVSRIDQISTLLKNLDARQLIREKPHLFANMLGNTESLLVIRYVDGATLLEVNPMQRAIPVATPVAAGQKLSLEAVHHADSADGTPMIYMAAISPSTNNLPPLEILTARVLSDRTHILAEYRNNILFFASLMAVISVVLAVIFARRGVSPLRRLADRTAQIGTRTLSFRLNKNDVPTELDTLIDQTNAMLERMERGFQQLKQVSADMAHDLRTPITTLLGQTEVGLSATRDNAYYQRLLGSNFEELQRMSRMIDNMLFLAQAEQPDQVIQCSDIDISAEMARICAYFEDLAADRDVTLRTHGSGKVFADAMLLRRALANLLSNAVRFARAGSKIDLIAEALSDGMSIQVINHGETIAPLHQERIFDRFYRADPSRNNSAHSSGLGLSIVNSIMQLHQGRCWVESRDGITCFGLMFPDAKRLNNV